MLFAAVVLFIHLVILLWSGSPLAAVYLVSRGAGSCFVSLCMNSVDINLLVE